MDASLNPQPNQTHDRVEVISNDKKYDPENEGKIKNDGFNNSHPKKSSLQCPVCQKYYQNSRNLRIHERIHTEEVPFECCTCNKRFKTKYELKLHERSHTGEAPFGCKICMKRFKYSHHLKRHNRIHTGEMPYECSTCNKKFSEKIS